MNVRVSTGQAITDTTGSVIGYLCEGWNAGDFVGFTVDTVTGELVLDSVRSGDHPTVTVTGRHVLFGCEDWCGSYEDLHDEARRTELREAYVTDREQGLP